MHSNRYTLLYAAGISVITAVILAIASEGLRPAQEANIALDKKSNILRSVRMSSTDRKTIESTYSEKVRDMVVNSSGEELPDVDAGKVNLKNEIVKAPAERLLPLYIYSGESGKIYYIIPVRGVGLWGPIWGYISLENDFNTVYGAFFDHKGETPGLGAEIAESAFQKQFEGKKIMSEEGQFVCVRVVKKTDKFALGDAHRVDGVSGGTITSNGTDAMLKNCIEPYLAYFEKLKSNAGQTDR
ncbi:MAG: NADH:ubiquinone reductase (Na(+)-transporting) subunit C [Saprospirales bacterium]|nr:NADH:ubiquinone reductase (Na(+)-transporting) subunit C [Saprospirales bacterium]MBK8921532.1 NADH:ubiquinone reductase (Na(+)-transporting) subunit C [Saprospirales bacterium]